MALSVSIIIKALNEEALICRTIESCLVALKGLDGEVILADSLSTDRTVEIASLYPIKVVQIINAADRSCGVGAQLGYLHSCGEYLYVIDGDMELSGDFLRWAVSFLDSNPQYAAVGGAMEQLGGGSYEFRVRNKQVSRVWKPGNVRWLVGGGLYRRTAIQHGGYMTNRNLHSYEEKELGLRLVSSGWQLLRADRVAIRHHAHSDSSAKLMVRRWRSKYVAGSGELLRSAWGTPYFAEVLAAQRMNFLFVALWLWIGFSLFISSWSTMPLMVSALGIAVLFVASCIRKKSLKDGLLSLTNFQVYAAGLVRGLLNSQTDPRQPIASRVITPGCNQS